MDWKLAMKEERAALKRIVALLFALADLAESAGRRSSLVRRFVIWVLRQAETVGRDIIIGAAEAQSSLMPASPASDSPAEAMRLAQSFRDLAGELDLQSKFVFAIQHDAGEAGLMQAGAFRPLDMRGFLNALQRLVVVSTACPAAWATCPPDTS